MNVQLLNEIKNYILANPESYNQGVWAEKTDSERCGTKCCIAGFACLLTNSRNFDTKLKANPYGSFVSEWGQELLGLDRSQANELFLMWDAPYTGLYYQTKTAQGRAQVGADYINYFINKYKEK
jgi:hypothetical protein